MTLGMGNSSGGLAADETAASNLCRILRMADLSLKQGHGVGCCGPDHARFPVRIANDGFELADWFLVPDVLDFDAGGDRLSDADGPHEPLPGPGRSSATTAFKR